MKESTQEEQQEKIINETLLEVQMTKNNEKDLINNISS